MLELGPGIWSLDVDSERAWAPPRTIQVEKGAGVHSEPPMVVFPTAKVSAAIQASAPIEWTLEFASPPGTPEASRVPRGTTRCGPARLGETIECRAPIGKLDLALRAKEFVPYYLWDFPVRSDGANQLGLVRNRRGGSLSGFVERDGAPVEAARVALTAPDGHPIEEADGSSTPGRQRWLQSLTNRRGFFQLAGMSPGEYQIEATAADGRAAIAAARSEAGREVRLGTLALADPLALEVTVDPPIPPDGKNWALSVVRIPSGIRLLSRNTDANGRVVLRPLARGEYGLELHSRDQRWHSEIISIDEPPGPVVIRVAPVRVKGLVLFGEEPLAARLVFGARRDPSQLALESGADGRFEGLLPRAGRWPVELTSVDPSVHRTLGGVEIDPAPSGEAVVEIRVPTTRVRGRVLDPEGRGVSSIVNAIPSGTSGDHQQQVHTGPSGEFALSGFPVGPVLFDAQTADGVSDVVSVMLEEGRESTVELRLRKRGRLRGRVFGPRGAVAGAEVLLWPASLPRTGSPMLRTDAEGVFEAEIVAGTKEVEFLLRASGSGVRLARQRVDEGSELILWLPAATGTLTLQTPPGLDLLAAGSPAVVLFGQGAELFVPLLAGVAGNPAGTANPASSASVVLEGMAAGEYALCLLNRQAYLENRDVEVANDCARGSLAAGAGLSLALR